MFELLKNLLFDEEDVLVEEDNLEQIDFTKVDDFEDILSEAPNKPMVQSNVQRSPEKSETLAVKEKEDHDEVLLRTEFNIQLKDEPKKEKAAEIKTKRPERAVSEKKERDIEINSVISPMFGEGEGKKVEALAPSSPVTKKKDGLGTVISPIYGQAELNVHEQEAIAKIKENEQADMPVIEEDDWKDDIPLEELISGEEENDECVQFSLFGDNKSINE